MKVKIADFLINVMINYLVHLYHTIASIHECYFIINYILTIVFIHIFIFIYLYSYLFQLVS